MKKITIMILITGLFIQAYSQEGIRVKDETVVPKMEGVHRLVDIGFGIGTDYGGILGIKVGVSPIKYLTLFGAAGIQVVKFGWTVGAMGYIISKTSDHFIRPYVKVMYGVNAAIKVIGASEYDKLYLGPSVGAGAELRFGKKKRHGLNLDINYPFRSQKFEDDLETVKNDPRIGEVTELLPVAFSLGYHIEF